MVKILNQIKEGVVNELKTHNSEFVTILFKCIILALMLFLSVFVEAFVWVALATALLFTVTQRNARMIYYLIFLMPLMGIFRRTADETYYLSYLVVVVLMYLAIRLIIQVIKKEKQINWWFSIIFAILFVYFLYPFSIPNMSITFSLLMGLCILFVVYYYKDELDEKELIFIFVFGVLASVFVGLFKPCSTRLQTLISTFYGGGLKRFSGAYTNPNILSGESMFALALLMTLFLKGKIKYLFYPLFVLFEIILIFTLSKSGIIIFGTSLLVFLILNLIKNKNKYGLITTAVVLLLSISIIGIFNTRFDITLGRMTVSYHHDVTYTIEDIIKDENGSTLVTEREQHDEAYFNVEQFTTGRSTIWMSYMETICSSFKTLIFGFGVGAPYIGHYNGYDEWCPHNTYIQCLYYVGLLGVLLMATWLISSNGIKKIKHFKYEGIVSLLSLAMYLFSLEFFSFRLGVYLTILLYVLFAHEKTKISTNLENQEQKIPKKIHYIWLGGKELSSKIQKCIESWKKFCPDYEIKRWDESNLNINCCNYCKEAYDAKKYAFASDVLRFDVLNKEGGIYLDVDVQLLKPLDDLLVNDFFVGFESKILLNPGLVMGATKGNKLLKELYNSYKSDKFILDDGSLNLNTICTRTTNYLVQKGLKTNNTLQKLDEVVVYPTEYFCPLSPITGIKTITENTYAMHLYYSSWYSLKAKTKKYVKKTLNFITNGYFGQILLKFKRI